MVAAVFSLTCRITGSPAASAPATMASACSSWTTLKAPTPVASVRAPCVMMPVDRAAWASFADAGCVNPGEWCSKLLIYSLLEAD